MPRDLRDVVGRIHDVVRIGGRSYPTHYLQDLLDRIGGVAEFQVEQKNGRLLLRLVAEGSAPREEIARRVRSWWGGDVETEFTGFEGLKRFGRQAKFRYLVPAEGT